MTPQRLLVIDDDEATAELFARVGEMEGFDVRTANRAADAQERVRESTPDVIILDMVMPDMDGIEMVKWLTGQGYQGRVVLVSGFSEAYLNAASAMAKAKGISDVAVLTKPIELEDLRAAISAREKA